MRHNKKVALVALSLATVVLMGSASGIAHASSNDTREGRGEMRHMRQHRVEHLTQRLNQAVADGKLTEDQKNQIIEQMRLIHEQAVKNREIEDKSERHNANKDLRDQMKQWLKDKGIDPKVILPRPFFNR